MKFFTILSKAISDLARWVRIEILIIKANRNIRRRNKKQH